MLPPVGPVSLHACGVQARPAGAADRRARSAPLRWRKSAKAQGIDEKDPGRVAAELGVKFNTAAGQWVRGTPRSSAQTASCSPADERALPAYVL